MYIYFITLVNKQFNSFNKMTQVFYSYLFLSKNHRNPKIPIPSFSIEHSFKCCWFHSIFIRCSIIQHFLRRNLCHWQLLGAPAPPALPAPRKVHHLNLKSQQRTYSPTHVFCQTDIEILVVPHWKLLKLIEVNLL